jgi:hypothetical protein
MENFVCKTVPSPEDERDWNAGTIYKKTGLESILDLRDSLPPIRNQGSQGTCAAQTAACMKEWQEKKDYNFEGYMSPQFIYNNRENQDSHGMFGRDVMRILSKIGSVEDAIYEYGKIEPVLSIDPELYDKAKMHKIKNYARIFDIENLKKALSINGPCYIAFPTYNYGPRMWYKESPDTQMQGGHAMTIVGYNGEGFIIRNTWGSNWGDKGYCVYPYGDWGSHWEIWTTIDEKSYIDLDDVVNSDEEIDVSDDIRDSDVEEKEDEEIDNDDDVHDSDVEEKEDEEIDVNDEEKEDEVTPENIDSICKRICKLVRLN